MATIKKIGILGGSFNPPHTGHLEISQTILNTLCLDEVWWVITSNNPFKNKTEYESLESRIQKANKIIKDSKIAIREFERRINSNYTIDLINYLQYEYNHNFVWIMGTDNLQHFHRWHRTNDILSAIKIAICNRPNYEVNDNNLQQVLHCDTNLIFKGNAQDFMNKNSPKVIYIKSTNNNNSSSKIRNKD